MAEELDLATLDGLTAAVNASYGPTADADDLGRWNGTFCAQCGEPRRMQLVRLHWEDRWAAGRTHHSIVNNHSETPPADKDAGPSLFAALCLQCQSVLTLVVHKGPQAFDLVALPSTYGGLSTANTPESVAYYLDQAQRAQSVAALSAAVAMYRAALEHLLHDQGYKDGMLGKRIESLVNDEQAPEWRARLHPDYLGVINKLGSAAIHANDGDVQQQLVFDAQLLREVRELFIELLDEVYEQPDKKASRISRLQQVVGSFKRN